MRTDVDLFSSAIKRYAKDCASMGAIYEQPNNWLCTVKRRANGATVTLENENGKLAIYQFSGPSLRIKKLTRAA